jgi:hypothetical protein
MTFSMNKSSTGFPPPPVTELTVEQQFKMRQIEDALNSSKGEIDAIITLFLALQKQCFVLGNNVSNLVSKWPLPLTQPDQNIIDEVVSKFGISFETKD